MLLVRFLVEFTLRKLPHYPSCPVSAETLNKDIEMGTRQCPCMFHHYSNCLMKYEREMLRPLSRLYLFTVKESFVLSRFIPSPKSSGASYWQRHLLNHRFATGATTVFYVFKSSNGGEGVGTPFFTPSSVLSKIFSNLRWWSKFFLLNPLSIYWVFQKPMSSHFFGNVQVRTLWSRHMDYSHGVVCTLPLPKAPSAANSPWCPEHRSLQLRLGMNCFTKKFPLKMEMYSFICSLLTHLSFGSFCFTLFFQNQDYFNNLKMNMYTSSLRTMH